MSSRVRVSLTFQRTAAPIKWLQRQLLAYMEAPRRTEWETLQHLVGRRTLLRSQNSHNTPVAHQALTIDGWKSAHLQYLACNRVS